VRPHPHIGIATVTYLFEGEILHRGNRFRCRVAGQDLCRYPIH
jgi:redox-sensitive bicupin YhaK (pirin superfamily)